MRIAILIKAIILTSIFMLIIFALLFLDGPEKIPEQAETTTAQIKNEIVISIDKKLLTKVTGEDDVYLLRVYPKYWIKLTTRPRGITEKILHPQNILRIRVRGTNYIKTFSENVKTRSSNFVSYKSNSDSSFLMKIKYK